MSLPPDQLTQCSWSMRQADTTALVHGNVLFCRVASSRSRPGGNSTSFQTHQVFLPLELSERIVGMLQLRLCGAKQLEMPRLHKDLEITDYSLETSSVSQPVPLLLDKIPRAKCGLLTASQEDSPLSLAGPTGSELSRTLTSLLFLLGGREGDFDLHPKGLSSLDAMGRTGIKVARGRQRHAKVTAMGRSRPHLQRDTRHSKQSG